MPKLSLVALGALALASVARADLPKGDLEELYGSWVGGGTSFGRPSTATLELKPMLDGKFLELGYTVQSADAGKPFRFEGRAFYERTGDRKWRAWWFDSQGATHPIEATATEESVTAEWGTDATQRGRTIYRRVGDGRIEIVDWILRKDGSWQEFARQALQRAD